MMVQMMFIKFHVLALSIQNPGLLSLIATGISSGIYSGIVLEIGDGFITAMPAL